MEGQQAEGDVPDSNSSDLNKIAQISPTLIESKYTAQTANNGTKLDS